MKKTTDTVMAKSVIGQPATESEINGTPTAETGDDKTYFDDIKLIKLDSGITEVNDLKRVSRLDREGTEAIEYTELVIKKVGSGRAEEKNIKFVGEDERRDIIEKEDAREAEEKLPDYLL